MVEEEENSSWVEQSEPYQEPSQIDSSENQNAASDDLPFEESPPAAFIETTLPGSSTKDDAPTSTAGTNTKCNDLDSRDNVPTTMSEFNEEVSTAYQNDDNEIIDEGSVEFDGDERIVSSVVDGFDDCPFSATSHLTIDSFDVFTRGESDELHLLQSGKNAKTNISSADDCQSDGSTDSPSEPLSIAISDSAEDEKQHLSIAKVNDIFSKYDGFCLKNEDSALQKEVPENTSKLNMDFGTEGTAPLKMQHELEDLQQSIDKELGHNPFDDLCPESQTENGIQTNLTHVPPIPTISTIVTEEEKSATSTSVRPPTLTVDNCPINNESISSNSTSSTNKPKLNAHYHRPTNAISRRRHRTHNQLGVISETPWDTAVSDGEEYTKNSESGGDGSDEKFDEVDLGNSLVNDNKNSDHDNDAQSVDAMTTTSTSSSSSSLSTWRRRTRSSSDSAGGASVGSAGGNSSSTGSTTGGSLGMVRDPDVRSVSRRRRGVRSRNQNGASSANEISGHPNGEGDTRQASRRRGGSIGNVSSLVASLDSGMAALRRWIRSKGLGANSNASAGSSSGLSSSQSLSSSSVTTLRQEDIFALSHAGDNDGNSGFLYYAPQGLNDDNLDTSLLHPLVPTNSLDTLADRQNGQSRQRSFSEPDRARLTDFFSSVYGSRAIDGSRNATLASTENSAGAGSFRGLNSTLGLSRQRLLGVHNSSQRTSEQEHLQSQVDSTGPTDQSNIPSIRQRAIRGWGQLSSRSENTSSESTIDENVGSSSVNTSSITSFDRRSEQGNISQERLESATGISSTTETSASNERGQDRLHETRNYNDIPTSSAPGVTQEAAGPSLPTSSLEAANDVNPPSSDVPANDVTDSTSGDAPGTADRQARARWIRINTRFQLIITIVALLFSLLLFAILVCWVLLTTTFVLSFDKQCDVPLKSYFWFASFQLVLDIFRADIMRWLCHWRRSDTRNRIPPRVVMYNVAYLVYAMVVLRIGFECVFLSYGNTCYKTAPEFFAVSTIFVCLSIAAWGTIFLGYIVPFCFVAVLLTRNGYFPNADTAMGGVGPRGMGGMGISGVVGDVFPNAYSNPAPPECIERLRVVLLDEFPESYPKDCCICLASFSAGEVIVVTPCEHVFHKRCCKEWLHHSRTCPYCRRDLPASLGLTGEGSTEEFSVPNDSISGAGRGPSDDNRLSDLLHFFRTREWRRSAHNDTSSVHPQGVSVIEITQDNDSTNEVSLSFQNRDGDETSRDRFNVSHQRSQSLDV